MVRGVWTDTLAIIAATLIPDIREYFIVRRVYDGVPPCNSAVNDEDDDEDNENGHRPEASYTHRMIIILMNARRYESPVRQPSSWRDSRNVAKVEPRARGSLLSISLLHRRRFLRLVTLFACREFKLLIERDDKLRH